jgi:membrane-bound lytic murein transglycosylase B
MHAASSLLAETPTLAFPSPASSGRHTPAAAWLRRRIAAAAAFAAALALAGGAIMAPGDATAAATGASATPADKARPAPRRASAQPAPARKAAPSAQRNARPSRAPAAAGATAAAATAVAVAGEDLLRRPALQELVRTLVDEHRFDEAELRALFGKVRRVPEVLRLIAPPPPGFRRSWSAYRTRFIDPLRIREGVRFWGEHEATLARAQQRFGVPAEIIVAIIGVETIYGRVMGEFRVIDALTTLGLEDPRRAAYFRDELAEFLLHTREASIDPLSVRGSYAGATGIPQFMPASIRRFAVDFDGDGAIDLRRSSADAIGSVARFLAEHGWRTGEASHFEVEIDDAARAQALIDGGIEPRVRPGELASHGLRARGWIPSEMPLALIDLPDGDGPTRYLLGGPNFYVVTRYNRSNFYAMAVLELADTLRTSRAR